MSSINQDNIFLNVSKGIIKPILLVTNRVKAALPLNLSKLNKNNVIVLKTKVLSEKRKEEYDFLKKYSCKHNGKGKCCQATLRRLNSSEVICCYENGCHSEPCRECFRNKN